MLILYPKYLTYTQNVILNLFFFVVVCMFSVNCMIHWCNSLLCYCGFCCIAFCCFCHSGPFIFFFPSLRLWSLFLRINKLLLHS